MTAGARAGFADLHDGAPHGHGRHPHPHHRKDGRRAERAFERGFEAGFTRARAEREERSDDA